MKKRKFFIKCLNTFLFFLLIYLFFLVAGCCTNVGKLANKAKKIEEDRTFVIQWERGSSIDIQTVFSNKDTEGCGNREGLHANAVSKTDLTCI